MSGPHLRVNTLLNILTPPATDAPLTAHCLAIIPSGIQAEVLVVKSFEELKQRASEAEGKIVVFNQPFVSYGETVAYRAYGASEAAKAGAVATLIRSITPLSINRYTYYTLYCNYILFMKMTFKQSGFDPQIFDVNIYRPMFSLSLCSPHTGWQDYQDGVKRIPTACITTEDAELMWRAAQRGQRIVVKLTMEARTLPDADSFNTVAEIKGWQHPEQVSSLRSQTHIRLVCLPVYHLCVPELTWTKQVGSLLWFGSAGESMMV